MKRKEGRYLQIQVHLALAVVMQLLCQYLASTTLAAGYYYYNNTNAIRCKERERQALLFFKQHLVDDWGLLSSWGSEEYKQDCCQWRGVECSNGTGHVIVLDIHGSSPILLRGNITPSLLDLKHLQYLDLSGNDFGQTPIPKFLGSLTELRVLDLSYANFSGFIPGHLGNLSNLRYLNLANKYTNAKSLGWLSGLSFMQYLDMSTVYLGNASDWLATIEILPSLSILNLNFCDLPDNVPSLPSTINSSKSIANLYLAFNCIGSTIHHWLPHLSGTLVELYIVDTCVKSPILDNFQNMTSLSFLSLSLNQLEGPFTKSLGKLCNLKKLYLVYGEVSGDLSEFLNILSGCAEEKLETLNLFGNHFTGLFPNLRRFLSLRNLYVAENQLNGFAPESITQMHSIEVLDLSINKIKGALPDFTIGSSLKELYLGENQMNGTLTTSIGRLSELETLDLRKNFFEGVITEGHLANLTKLKYLDLSSNSFIFNLSSLWFPTFQLSYIALQSCKLGTYFPRWLQSQRNFSQLDISNCGISDTIPTWFWDLSPILSYLNVSHNQIKGKLPDLTSKFVEHSAIDMSFNELEGHIPPLPINLSSLDLSNNKFCGTISFICSLNGEALLYLDLSVNQFFGEIPNCWAPFKGLGILNLANNGLSGMLPNSMGYLSELRTLNLCNNNFTGRLPVFFQNYTCLVFADLSMNQLSGEIPPWIGERLSWLRVLNLRSNKFYGTISSKLCHLQNISVLDLSHNGITGTIPSCLSNLTAMSNKDALFATLGYIYGFSMKHWKGYTDSTYTSQHVDSAILGWKGQDHEYTGNIGLLRVIDLSSNKLYGVLPEGITRLVGLVALNLSRNKLQGIIPPDFGQLTLLESLDLSRNQFYGEIPATMVKLNFLSYLDLSYNRLSGRIPSSTQLQSFNASQYIGNAGLCGPPITLKCLGDEESKVKPISEEDQEDGEEFERWFYIGGAFGFVTGFWGVCGAILLSRSWRHAYFHFLDRSMNYLQVTMAVHMTKLLRKLRRVFC
ncbi:Non-specific serine/threonine protein kinase [Bertholletia excelsa]